MFEGVNGRFGGLFGNCLVGCAWVEWLMSCGVG